MAAPASTSKAPSMRSFLKGTSAFVMFRFPFMSALVLTMLCSEREQAHKAEGFPVFYIYIHIAVMFLCGTMLSFNSQRPLFAVITTVSMALFSMVTQSQQQTNKTWLIARVASHDVGVIGVFLILASRAAEDLKHKHKLHFLYPYGKNLISIFCIINAVQLYRTPEERRAFFTSLPHNEALMITLGAAMLVGGFLFSSEFQSKRVAAFLVVALGFYILTIDSNMDYWHHRVRIEYWMQMNMMLNSATVVCALIFIAV